LTMIEANHIFHLKTNEQLQWKEKGEKKKKKDPKITLKLLLRHINTIRKISIR
jgi:hypothetical protein